MQLAQLFDYFGQLSAQIPIAPVRVVYAKAGSLPAACIIRGGNLLVENLLYWAPVGAEAEALYLSAILNG